MAQLAIIRQMCRQVSLGSAGDYQAHEQAGVAPQLASIRQMSMQVSCGSAGDYQADERAGIAQTSWRLLVR